MMDTGKGCGWQIGKRALGIGLALAGAFALATLLDGCAAKERAADIFCAAPAVIGLAGAFTLAIGLAILSRP
jgi:hypothetical protein